MYNIQFSCFSPSSLCMSANSYYVGVIYKRRKNKIYEWVICCQTNNNFNIKYRIRE